MTLTTPTQECSICLFDSTIAKIHEDGVCEYCLLQQKLRENSRLEDFPKVLEKIVKSGKDKQYDCLIGISGGEDSSVMLWLAVKYWGLRPLVIHFDNRTNRPEAENNMRVLTSHLNVNSITYFVNKKEYEELTDAFLVAGLPDADIPNDIAMAKLMYTTARDHGIKYILNGHDFRNEGSTPKTWTVMDAKYIQSVYTSVTGKKLKNYPLYTFKDQLISALLGIKQVRPFHYSDFNRGFIVAQLVGIGWKPYGGKHNENIYTAFVGSFLLPRKFKIDKRRVYLSAQIREMIITKTEARKILARQSNFALSDLGDRMNHVMNLVNRFPVGKREDYKRYNFKRYRIVLWVMAKMKILPWTFYVKYCI